VKALQTTVTTLLLRLSRRVPSQLLCYQPLCICGMVLLFPLTAAHSADEDSFSLFLAGDMIVMRPLSNSDDPRFLELVHEIRNADAAVVNLETLFHDFEGYPQADSGGTYMVTSPEIEGFGVGRH
jgi:Bacterial capsule synthesis protein PGA_cap